MENVPDMRYYPEEPTELPPAGVQLAWFIDRANGRAIRVQMIQDDEGNGVIVGDGEWQDVTIVDDTPSTSP